MDTKGEGNGQQGNKKRGEMRFLLSHSGLKWYTIHTETCNLYGDTEKNNAKFVHTALIRGIENE